jgi:hypothetical protein
MISLRLHDLRSRFDVGDVKLDPGIGHGQVHTPFRLPGSARDSIHAPGGVRIPGATAPADRVSVKKGWKPTLGLSSLMGGDHEVFRSPFDGFPIARPISPHAHAAPLAEARIASVPIHPGPALRTLVNASGRRSATGRCGRDHDLAGRIDESPPHPMPDSAQPHPTQRRSEDEEQGGGQRPAQEITAFIAHVLRSPPRGS